MKGIKKVKTAVIGCGAISRIYFENMTNAFEILEVAGCCDLNQQLAEDTAAAYDIPVLTMEEILEDSGIEIVVNLTNPAAHYGVIRNLLEGSMCTRKRCWQQPSARPRNWLRWPMKREGCCAAPRIHSWEQPCRLPGIWWNRA